MGRFKGEGSVMELSEASKKVKSSYSFSLRSVSEPENVISLLLISASSDALVESLDSEFWRRFSYLFTETGVA